MGNPKCFISYSWDSEAHKDWVRYLSEKLQEKGIDVRLDQWDLHLGADLPQYMESSIRDTDYILLICTPSYAEKSNTSKGGVGYEKSIVTGEIFHDSPNESKFVPILRTGEATHSLPSYLKSKVYIDFTDNEKFSLSLEILLRHLYQSPMYVRPPLGSKPSFGSQSAMKSQVGSTLKPHPKKFRYCAVCGTIPRTASKCTMNYGT